VHGAGISLELSKRAKEDKMIKKMITILVILSFFGISTAYAYGPEDDHRSDQAAGIAVVAVLTAVTAVFLLASHDRHREQLPAPRHLSNNPYDSKNNDNYRPRDYRNDDNYRPHDSRNNDNYQYDNRYQGEGPSEGNKKKWEGR
jgi:hypothetical protein